MKKDANSDVQFMAGATRLELAAFCVTGRRSNQTELRPRRCSMFKVSLQTLSRAVSVKGKHSPILKLIARLQPSGYILFMVKIDDLMLCVS